MGKRDVDRKVAHAMEQLTAPKEDAIRDLAAALDEIETINSRLLDLNQQRDKLIDDARAKHATAKKAGWKVKELTGAGLTIPRPLTLPLKQDSTSDHPARDNEPGSNTTPPSP